MTTEERVSIALSAHAQGRKLGLEWAQIPSDVVARIAEQSESLQDFCLRVFTMMAKNEVRGEAGEELFPGDYWDMAPWPEDGALVVGNGDVEFVCTSTGAQASVYSADVQYVKYGRRMLCNVQSSLGTVVQLAGNTVQYVYPELLRGEHLQWFEGRQCTESVLAVLQLPSDATPQQIRQRLVTLVARNELAAALQAIEVLLEALHDA